MKTYDKEETMKQLALCHRAHKGKPEQGEQLIEVDGVQAIISGNSVGFAGSNEFVDWIRNFDFSLVPNPYGCGHIHQGWLRYAEKAWDALLEFHKKHEKVKYSGHSLGACIAALLANRRAYYGQCVDGLWMFGSPKIGDRQFVRNFHVNKYERIVNGKDLVTMLPLGRSYVHLPRVKREGKKGISALFQAILKPRKTHWHTSYMEAII